MAPPVASEVASPATQQAGGPSAFDAVEAAMLHDLESSAVYALRRSVGFFSVGPPKSIEQGKDQQTDKQPINDRYSSDAIPRASCATDSPDSEGAMPPEDVRRRDRIRR